MSTDRIEAEQPSCEEALSRHFPNWKVAGAYGQIQSGAFRTGWHERGAEIARLQQERDAANARAAEAAGFADGLKESLDHAANDRDRAMTEGNAATREAEALREEVGRLRATLDKLQVGNREWAAGEIVIRRRERPELFAAIDTSITAPTQPGADDRREVMPNHSVQTGRDNARPPSLEAGVSADDALANPTNAAPAKTVGVENANAGARSGQSESVGSISADDVMRARAWFHSVDSAWYELQKNGAYGNTYWTYRAECMVAARAQSRIEGITHAVEFAFSNGFLTEERAKVLLDAATTTGKTK